MRKEVLAEGVELYLGDCRGGDAVNMRAMKFVSYERLQDHLRLGWLVSLPNGPMHHHVYGCELAWICDCPVPGGFKAYRRRVYVSEASQNEEKHERTGT